MEDVLVVALVVVSILILVGVSVPLIVVLWQAAGLL